MNSNWLKIILPHFIAVIVLLAVGYFYFSPYTIEGKVLSQSDIIQAKGPQVEMNQYKKSENRDILWTNSMFSGMPTYQLGGIGGNDLNVMQKITGTVFRLNSPLTSPLSLVFCCFLGFYILGISLGVDWRLSLFGSIAFGLSTTNMILLEAGHLNKVLTLAYLAPTFAGIYQIYKGRYLLGAAITALFMMMQVAANHVQITYYFMFLVGFFVLFCLISAIKSGHIKEWVIASVTTGLALLIGVLPNATNLLTTQEYSQETIRGKTELTTTDKPQEGLTKDYAFDWSQGKLESFNLLIPNFMGGTSAESFVSDRSSESYKFLSRMTEQEQANQLAQMATHYWGEQPFTSGAQYYGAILSLLFVLGLFLIKSPMRWWGLSSILLILMISWGKYFPAVNYFLFDHFPLFNKFRAVNMVVGLGHLVIIALGLLGLQEFFNKENSNEERLSALYKATGVVGALCLFGVLYSFMGNMEGANDANLSQQLPQFLSALKTDRAALLRGDAIRSLGFVLAGAALLWAYLKMNLSPYLGLILIGLLSLLDIFAVNKRYLPNERFMSDRQNKAVIEPSNADKLIQKDADPYFRVYDLTRNPFSNALTSYHHKSVGGYHAAKLMVYQEMIDKYLLPTGQGLTDPSQIMNIMNMLNVKYFIVPGEKEQATVIPNPQYLGNAWFVRNVKVVENANAELDSLKNLKSESEAVIQKRFADKIQGLNIQYDTANTIQLTKYVPDHLSYKYNAKTEQLAVFSDIYYPEAKGWKVYIDGNKVENALMKANYVLRAARVPAGAHTLEMKFEPASYAQGKSISTIGALLVLGLFLLGLGYTWMKDRAGFTSSLENVASFLGNQTEKVEKTVASVNTSSTSATQKDESPTKAQRKKK